MNVMASALNVLVSGLSDIGKVRKENEDSLSIHQPTGRDVLAQKGVLIVLADGMGGLEEGRAASRLAVETVVEKYYEGPDEPRAALEASVQQANRAIYDHSLSREGGRHMGSTVTAVAIVGSHACVAQVGDSRAYCYRGGVIHQITRDHSLVRELVDMGRIEETSPHYAFHRNVLTRGLGLREHVAVDLYELQDLEDGDHLLLSSDGLHELVRPEELAACLEKFGADTEGACEELVRTARERGGPDNITAVIACMQAEGGSQKSHSRERVALRKLERSSVGWLLPIVIFASFVLGVLLTLFVAAPSPINEDTEELLRSEVQAALEAAGGAGTDADRIQRVVEHLEGVKRMLEGWGGERE